MIFFLISFFSFFLLSKSLPFKPFCGVFYRPFWRKLKLVAKPSRPVIGKVCVSKEAERADDGMEMSLLDLPDLALDSILERLPPSGSGLCRMGQVCTSMRDRCRSDRLWEPHLNHKWGRLIGESASREWQCQVARSRKTEENRESSRQCRWSVLRAMLGLNRKSRCSSLPVDSVMARYLSLERGQLWFPAQVYNRENGHAGFKLSCYDAKISYDSKTDTFQARYSSHGRPTVEENIPWERLRAPPVDTPPYELHISDCLSILRPEDHIEIQWRKSKEFPYGWWYGTVGHVESCDGNENYCDCHQNDTVMLEFNQYPPESRWRRTSINRKSHREEGSETNGFYGGIRKLYKDSEISTWKSHSPTRTTIGHNHQHEAPSSLRILRFFGDHGEDIDPVEIRLLGFFINSCRSLQGIQYIHQSV